MLLDDFIHFWSTTKDGQLFRIFWYFFLFELTRYVIFDFIILIIHRTNLYLRRDEYRIAKEELWQKLPLVSVIVPGKNEGKNIYKLVKSMAEQTYQNFEIIVVDDGSDDETPIIGRDLQKNGLITLFLRNDVRGGKASAANLAYRYSKGEFILHLDADSSFDRKALENAMIPFYVDPTIGAVGGNLRVRNAHETLCTTLQSIEYMKTIGVGRMVTSYLGIYNIISGAFGLFRKEALEKVKGWDIGPGLDGDITMKIRKIGYRIHFESTAIGLTSAPTKFSVLSKQRLRWNKSIVRFRMRKHKDVFTPTEHFNFVTFFASAENIFYNIVMNILWYIHIIDMTLNFSHVLIYILPMSLILYTIANYLQFTAVVLLSDEKKDKLKYLPFLPLMVIYNGYYMRFIKSIAHFREMFMWASYKDNWNPDKSSQQAKRLQI